MDWAKHLTDYDSGHGLEPREVEGLTDSDLEELHKRASYRDKRAGIKNHIHSGEEHIIAGG